MLGQKSDVLKLRKRGLFLCIDEIYCNKENEKRYIIPLGHTTRIPVDQRTMFVPEHFHPLALHNFDFFDRKKCVKSLKVVHFVVF